MSERKKQNDRLLAMLCSRMIKSVSIVGMAKNVGKTVTMNYIIEQATQQGLCLGLTSVGRDGEKRDEVFHTPKPRIFAPLGCLLATARGTLKNSEIAIEVIKNTGFSTAMGEVIIGRALKSGYVELAGPTLMKEHRVLMEWLQQLGADLVIVDGALDRVSSATPALADGVILATGAAIGTSVANVMEKTKDRMERLTLPQVDPCEVEQYQLIMKQSKVACIDSHGAVVIVPAAGSLVAGKIISQTITPFTRTVVLAGAVGNGVLEGLLVHKELVKNLCLVIRNGTCLFCDRAIWRKFVEQGGSIKVVDPIELLAVTLNPTSIKGTGFIPQEFFELGARALTPYPVLDVVMGYSSM